MNRFALVMTIIGAINWGLMSFFSIDLVSLIFGSPYAIGSRIVYAVVFLSGLWCIKLLTNNYRPAKAGSR